MLMLSFAVRCRCRQNLDFEIKISFPLFKKVSRDEKLFFVKWNFDVIVAVHAEPSDF